MTDAEKLVERTDAWLAALAAHGNVVPIDYESFTTWAKHLLRDLRAHLLRQPERPACQPSRHHRWSSDPMRPDERFCPDCGWREKRPAEPTVRHELGAIHSHDHCGVIEGWLLQVARALGIDTTQGVTGSQVLDAIEQLREEKP